MKTLSVNGKFLSQTVTGVQRYATEIVRAWDQGLDAGWIDRTRYSIRVIAPKTVLYDPGYRWIGVEHGSTEGRFWEQVELPWRARSTLLFSPYAAAPVVKMSHAVTIHDAGAAAAPHQYSASFKAYCFLVFRMLGRSCEPIFTDSEFSRQELARYYSIPLRKMKVIPPGCDHLLHVTPEPAILGRSGLVRGQYVLGVSSQSVIKNFEGLVRAWNLVARPGMKLAVAGKKHERLFGAGAAEIDESVVKLGYVSDGELRSLYENAALFAYPSFYEGFGLPPVEAMSCGCPVLVARSSSLPEACGDAAVYCDPSDISDIANGISRVLDDPGFADLLRQKGKDQAARFKAKDIASRLWSELEPYIR